METKVLAAIVKIVFWLSICTNNYEWLSPFSQNEALRFLMCREAFEMGYFYPHEMAPGASLLRELNYAFVSCKDNPLEDSFYLHSYSKPCQETPGGTLYWCHIEFNRSFRVYCERQESLGGHHASVWALARREAEAIHEIYISLDMVSSHNVSLYKRRQHLRNLRRMLGDDLFESGYIPPCVPIHRFSLIDP